MAENPCGVMRSPKNIDVAITGKCNLRCKHCHNFTSARDVGRDLPLEEWLSFFEELGRLSVMGVTLEGAEPFCREDLREIIQGVVKNRMRFSIFSNATLIDDDMAGFLASTRRCNVVQVSIDGSSSKTHDALRGEGNFTKAINGIRSLQKHNIPVTVRVTINKYNLKDFENTARLLLEDFGIPSISTNSAHYMGLCRQNSGEIQLSVDDMSFAIKELSRVSKKYGEGRIQALAGPLSLAKHWVEMERARKNASSGFPGGGCLSSCGGVMNQLGVRSDGVIVPCILMGHMELGRINRDSLQEIWLAHPELIKMRCRNEVLLSEFKFCEGCDYIPYCRGSCPALAYTVFGNDFHPSPDACLRDFIKQGGRLPQEALV